MIATYILIAFGALVAGIYWLFFSASSQVLGRVLYEKTDERAGRLALTFDDGPNEPYTSLLLDVLKQHSVRATFFLVGENAERCPLVVQRMVAEGHSIGNHSFRHAFFEPIRSPDFRRELVQTQNTLQHIAGKRPALFRPPWFFRHAAMLRTAQALGLVTVTGTFGSWLEVFQPSPQWIARAALQKAKPGMLLVFHDGYNNRGGKRQHTVEAMQILIPELLRRGYRMVTVPELLSIRAYQ